MCNAIKHVRKSPGKVQWLNIESVQFGSHLWPPGWPNPAHSFLPGRRGTGSSRSRWSGAGKAPARRWAGRQSIRADWPDLHTPGAPWPPRPGPTEPFAPALRSRGSSGWRGRVPGAGRLEGWTHTGAERSRITGGAGEDGSLSGPSLESGLESALREQREKQTESGLKVKCATFAVLKWSLVSQVNVQS